MTSLDDLDGSSPMKDFLTQVIQTVRPKKEFATVTPSGVAGVSKATLEQTRADILARFPNSTAVSIDINTFYTGSPSLDGTAWDRAASGASTKATDMFIASHRSPSQVQEYFVITPAEWDAWKNLQHSDFIARVNTKLAATPVTTPGTTTPGTTTPVTTPGTTTPGATKVLYPGDTPMPVEYKEPDGTPESMEPNTSLTPDQKAQHAKYFTKAAQENVKTPDGGKRWREFFKNNYGKILSISAIVAVVIAVTIKALDSYLASEGAKVNFNSTKTVTGAAGGLFDAFITPTDVEIKWSVKKVGPGGLVSPKSSVRFMMGDAMHFNDSKLSEIEKQQSEEGVNPTKVPNTKNTFQVNTLTGDSTDIDYKNQGWGKIKTDFASHLGNAAKEATTEFASTFSQILSDLFEGLFGNIGTVLIIIFVVIAAFVVGGTVLQQLSKSST